MADLQEIPTPMVDSFKQLPKIVMIETGGTISAQSDDPMASSGYECGKLSVKNMLAKLPWTSEIADIEIVNVKTDGKGGSPDISSLDRLKLSKLVQQELDQGADIVIMPHGTDTMLLTAFFLSITIQSSKPIILLGATLPSNCYGADGDKNLVCAFILGFFGLSGDFVFDFNIFDPRYAIKLESMSCCPFYSFSGRVGKIEHSIPWLFYEPTKPKLFLDRCKIESAENPSGSARRSNPEQTK